VSRGVAYTRVRYNRGMNNETSFQLDTDAAEIIITDMASSIVQTSADAIAERAKAMVSSITSQPVSIETSTSVGTIRRGKRFIAKISAQGLNAHGTYAGHQALAKAKDAGRI
jgi:hypothetical protein